MNLKKRLPITIIIAVYSLGNLIGCATAPYTGAPPITGRTPGVYHHVLKGETLWRISKTYNVDLDQLARINHIPDAAKIEVGQKIFIPHGKRPISVTRSSKADEDFSWPLNGAVISSFNQDYANMVNKGINIRPSGSGDIIASRGGRVVFLSPSFRRYGKTVIIGHADGYMTIYAGNSEIYVKIKDHVSQGQTIARINPKGSLHNNYLHFEIRKGDTPKNPLFYLP